MRPFPFLWGAATSSHQVEGQNVHNDWWAWEVSGRLKTPSGIACDHYHRYPEDFKIAQELGHNAHRFSIEWSRLEPRENEWNQEAFDHYEKVFQELKAKGLEPVVTLHHFTSPQWFAEKGGWLSEETPFYFARFTRRVIEAFGRHVRFWITINEPLVYLYHGYFAGLWPPGISSFTDSMKVVRNQILAHIRAYEVIHEFYSRQNQPVWVSIAKHMGYFMPCNKWSLLDRLSVFFRGWFFNRLFLDALTTGFLFFPGMFCELLPRSETLDFIGVNYYTRDFIRFNGLESAGILGTACPKDHHAGQISELNTMGWDIYPKGLYHCLMSLKKYGLPLMITENGICAFNDEQRQRYILAHTAETARAKKEGTDIRGFFYWSLLDNFEWAHGFDPRFGIVEVDYQNLQRKVRKSAHVFSDSCRKLFAEGEKPCKQIYSEQPH